MLGFPILYFKGMRLIMFQLSGFHCTTSGRTFGIGGTAAGISIHEGSSRIPQAKTLKAGILFKRTPMPTVSTGILTFGKMDPVPPEARSMREMTQVSNLTQSDETRGPRKTP